MLIVFIIFMTQDFVNSSEYLTQYPKTEQALVKERILEPTCPFTWTDRLMAKRVSSLLLLINSIRPSPVPKCKHTCGKRFGFMFPPLTADTYNKNTTRGCYLFCPSKSMTQNEARAVCKKNGGDLVSIESKAEIQHLEQIMRTNPGKQAFDPINHRFTVKPLRGYWTSGVYYKETDKWIWQATGKQLRFAKWALHQPDNFAGEDRMYVNMENFRWNDVHAHKMNCPLCEIKTACVSNE